MADNKLVFPKEIFESIKDSLFNPANSAVNVNNFPHVNVDFKLKSIATRKVATREAAFITAEIGDEGKMVSLIDSAFLNAIVITPEMWDKIDAMPKKDVEKDMKFSGVSLVSYVADNQVSN